MPKRTKQSKGRQATGQRPVLQFRVHPDTYADLKAAAEKSKLTISEAAAARLESAAEIIDAKAEALRILDDAQSAVARSLEAALRAQGFQPIALDQGVVWAEPGMNISRLSISVDAAAIVRAMQPEMIAALTRALGNLAKDSDDG